MAVKLNIHENRIITAAIENGFTVHMVTVGIAKDCTMKWARAFVIFKYIEKIGEIIRSIPSVEDIEDERFDDVIELIVISQHPANKIRKGLMGISEVTDVSIESIDTNTALVTDWPGNRKVCTSEGNGCKGQQRSSSARTVRVDVNSLDYLMNLVGELIILKSRFEKDQNTMEDVDAKESIGHLNRVIDDLHNTMLKVRKVPIARMFNRLQRMIRGLSKELNKEITLYTYGEDIELDRTVIDEISSPLMELIRNAVDHGTEQAAGMEKHDNVKAENAVLRAYTEQNSVVIEVEIDGRGIDLESGVVEQLTPLPGCSVGLGRVKAKTESLGGTIEVYCNKNNRCILVIRLPVSLAILQALLIKLGDGCYAIPLSFIEEIVTVRREMIKKVHGREVVLLRGVILSLIRLSDVMEVKNLGRPGKELCVVVVRKGEKLVGIIADSLVGQQEIVIRPVDKSLAGINGVAGTTVLGDGRVSLILDTNSFF